MGSFGPSCRGVSGAMMAVSMAAAWLRCRTSAATKGAVFGAETARLPTRTHEPRRDYECARPLNATGDISRVSACASSKTRVMGFSVYPSECVK